MKNTSLWQDIPLDLWTDWRWQLNHAVTTYEDLSKEIRLTDNDARVINDITGFLKMRLSPHLIMLMKENPERYSLRKQFIPSNSELTSLDDARLYQDVNADDRYTIVKGLVRRYRTKVLIFPSNFCGSYCRYCFRRKLCNENESTLNEEEFSFIVNYLQQNPEINEVIFSGGDPLVVPDKMISHYLDELSRIPHIRIIRFHTRMPIVIPYRINESFIKMLTQYKSRFPIYFVIHVDTKIEISIETQNALAALVDNGFVCLASCPLLKDVNDNENELKDLWMELLYNRVKPYYLFQSDPVKGLRHFMVPIKRGMEIMNNLYDDMSGLAMPLYCFNVPDGGGHILAFSSTIKEIKDKTYELTNFEGKKIIYTEP